MNRFPIHNSRHFDIREFVDQRTWSTLYERCQWLIDPRIVAVADLFRQLAGVQVVINNWHFRKPGPKIYDSSGYRAVWDATGGRLSQHRAGRAIDVKAAGMSPEQMLQVINTNQLLFEQAGLTTIENLPHTPSWLHLDCRPRIPGIHPVSGFLLVDPV